MDKPDTERVVETFLPIIVKGDTQITLWHRYLDLIRHDISPLIKRLKDENLISWYSFLIHDKNSGVPTTFDDNRLFVHLRFEVALSANEQELREALPDCCLLTRRMEGPHPHPMGGIDHHFLMEADISHAWRILGESSEWVLRMLETHNPHNNIPIEHIAQFLHFIGNQLQTRLVNIPMP